MPITGYVMKKPQQRLPAGFPQRLASRVAGGGGPGYGGTRRIHAANAKASLTLRPLAVCGRLTVQLYVNLAVTSLC